MLINGRVLCLGQAVVTLPESQATFANSGGHSVRFYLILSLLSIGLARDWV